jgi:hypothetical protein
MKQDDIWLYILFSFVGSTLALSFQTILTAWFKHILTDLNEKERRTHL